ncbi:MAG: hypothetical protein ACI9X4_000181 [Glaciecola sp.]|jgi:hypothetical protein
MKHLLSITASSLLLSAALAAQDYQVQSSHGVMVTVDGERGPQVPLSLPDTPIMRERGVQPVYAHDALGKADVSSFEAPGGMVDREQTQWSTDRFGHHWARGTNYKAGFDSQGMKYIPFLGSHAPKNYPVRFTLESVRVGSASLPLAETGQVTRDGNHVEIDRGSTQVLYDLSTDSMEQSFTFTELPHHGELVLHLALNTEFSIDFRNNAVTFSNSLGGLTYDHAFAIDGQGNRIGLEIRPSGSGLDLVVPASFVAAAKGSLIVDPLIQSFAVDTLSGADLSDPDIAYSRPNDTYAAVYQEHFSGNDTDIYSRLIDGTTGAILTASIYVDSSDESWTYPSIAYQLQDDTFMVVAQTSNVGELESNIRVRTRSSSISAVGPVIDIELSSPGFECLRPDIGGDASFVSSSYLCLVWERDYGPDRDIAFATIQSDGSIVQAPALLRSSTSIDFSGPAISKSTGYSTHSYQWAVAWSTLDLGSALETVEVRRINFQGFPFGTQFLAAASSTDTFSHVDVTAEIRHPGPAGGMYFLVSAEQGPGVIKDHKIILCAGDATVDSIIIEETLHEDINIDQDGLQFASTDTSWIASYYRRVNATDWNIFACTLKVVHGRLAISEAPYNVEAMTLSGPLQNFPQLASASRLSGGSPEGETRAALIWVSESQSGDLAIRGALVDAGDRTPLGHQYCYGAVNSTGRGALILAQASLTNFIFEDLTAHNLPLNQFGYFLAGSGFGYIQNPGGSDGALCLGGGIGRYNQAGEIRNSGSTGTIELSFEPDQIRQPLGPVTAVSGQTWRFQAWFRDDAAGPGHSNFSNAVAITY